MRSSDGPRGRFAARALAPTLAAVLAACAPTQPTVDASAAQRVSTLCTVAAQRPDEGQTAAARVLQTRIEASPLFALQATPAGAVSCQLRYQPDGVLEFDYQFPNGGALQVKRDLRIETMEQDASLAVRTLEPATDILARAERSAFGPEGCRIDWRHAEVTQPPGGGGATVKTYRGEVCNCQARVREGADGRLLGLMLKSAC
jgi:hypothetical protein